MKNIAFSPVFHLQTFMAIWRHDSKTKLVPSERQNDRKKILTECLLASTAEFHTQLSSKVSRRKRLYFEFKIKFYSWTLLYNNVTVGFHVHLNAFQIKWTLFSRQKNALFFFLFFFIFSSPIARIRNLALDLRSKSDSFWLIYWQSQGLYDNSNVAITMVKLCNYNNK